MYMYALPFWVNRLDDCYQPTNLSLVRQQVLVLLACLQFDMVPSTARTEYCMILLEETLVQGLTSIQYDAHGAVNRSLSSTYSSR